MITRDRSFGGLTQEGLEIKGKQTFIRFNNILASTITDEEGKPTGKINFLNGYQFRGEHFDENGKEGIRVGIYEGDRLSLSFSINEGGVTYLGLFRVNLSVGDKSFDLDEGRLHVGDGTELISGPEFYYKNKSDAFELGDELIKWIERSIVTRNLEPFPVRLEPLLLPRSG